MDRREQPPPGRSMAELRAPFGSEGQYSGLRLQHIEATSAPDPFWDSFEQTGDSDAFGTGWANAMRAISAPTLLGALGMDRDGLVDEVFQRCAMRIARSAHEVRLGPRRRRNVEGPMRLLLGAANRARTAA